MQILEDLTGARAGRSPHGERGLKSERPFDCWNMT